MPAATISSPADSAPTSQTSSQITDVREPARTLSRKVALRHPPARTHQPSPQNASDRRATDDEILGIGDAVAEHGARSAEDPVEETAGDATRTQDALDAANIPEALRAALDANPELRRVWDDAQAYREAFATPEAARAATAQLADLNRLDSLFFSRRPEDHAELARAVAGLDPQAFASLAQAMAALANNPRPEPARPQDDAASGVTAAQTEFVHSANDAAVRGVLEAIESQVERLLPDGISKNARNRVVGEIYRELDTTLLANRQLGEQMRQAFRSGALDTAHQRAIVSLVTGRARQALPAVARRVLSEWTSTLVAANQDRRTRQRTAERRVDIAGASGGNDGRRAMTPRDLDYARLSDSDILNL